MSNKDPTMNGYTLENKSAAKDRRDVELTFLKKLNEKLNNGNTVTTSPNISEQGEKRGRTTSDNDNDLQFNDYGAPKRSRSTRRKSRTITNSSFAATTTTNNNNFHARMDYPNNQLKNRQQEKENNNNDGSYKFNITNNAVSYAIDQSLPTIKIECEPKVKEQKDGAVIIKELFKLIDSDFKQINPKHSDGIGFESWYIDFNGDLQCITRDIELFVYLCNDKHIPNIILDTKISLKLPRHLPPQRSIIIKGVPNTLDIDDVRSEIMNKYKSIYSIEEIIGTNNGRTRYLRLDLTNANEYKQLLISGIICIEGQCLHVFEYLAAPRVLFCSTCNLPGHNKKQCRFSFERCKRCGENRKNGDHKECKIFCHNCKGDHVSTDFRCPAIQCYRRDLIQHLQHHPEKLPADVQFFIPSQYRVQGESILFNRNQYSHRIPYSSKMKIHTGNAEWPSLSPPTRSTIMQSNLTSTNMLNDIQTHLNRLEKECTYAKEEYDRRSVEIKSQINTSITQLQTIITCFSSIIQRQNETIFILKSTINECLEFNKITNHAICLMMAKSGEQQYEEMIKQLSTIPIAERQATIEKVFLTYAPLIDEITVKITEVTKHLQTIND